MKTALTVFLALAASFPALAAYPDAKAAAYAGNALNWKNQFDESIAAYDEAIQLAADDNQRINYALNRADVLNRAGRKAEAIADLYARAEGKGRDVKIRFLTKAVDIAKTDWNKLGKDVRRGSAELAALHGEAFKEAADPVAKQRSALARAGFYDNLGDSTNVLACYQALLDIPDGTYDTKLAALAARANYFRNHKRAAEAVAAYDEAIAFSTNAWQRNEYAVFRADMQASANKKADAIADLFARAEGQGRDAKIRLLSKAVSIAKSDKKFADQTRKGNAALAVLHGEAFEAASDPAAKQRSAFVQASCYEALGDSTNVLACYHAVFALTNGTPVTKFAALNAEAVYLRTHKRAADALAVASNALSVAVEFPDPTRLRDAWNTLGETFFSLKQWDNAVSAFAKGTDASAHPRVIAGNGWEAILNITRAGRHDEALAWCDRIRKISNLHPNHIIKSYEIEGRCLNAAKRPKDTLALYDRLLVDTNFNTLVDMGGFVKMAAPLVRGAAAYGPGAMFAFYEKVFDNPEKYNVSTNQARGILDDYAAKTWRLYDRARMRKALDLAVKFGKPFPPDSNPVRFMRFHEEMDAFPTPEEKIKIPNDLNDFGFDPNRKVVHAKDFGWNPTNVTECLQKAIDSDASTVVIDDMGSPWYIWNITISKEKGSNKKILFKKGVVVLSAPEHRENPGSQGHFRRDMFHLSGPTNLVIMGEGDPAKHDTYIGKYRSRKERLEVGFKYGGCGFSGGCRNTLIKNLYVANCGQDALAWGGHNSFVVDCVFDDNFRQGMSLGGSYNCVYKNVTFCNTFGGEPHCGVDVEPYYELYSCPHHYFFDCHFYNNASKNFLFATSTYAPTTFYFKRCEFEASPNGNIGVLARPGIYTGADFPAPSKIIFEDCRMDGYSDGNVIQFLSTFLFNITFRNCVVNEKGLFRKNEKPNQSPIHLSLDRATWDGFYPHAGIVTFENFTINGYRDVPLVSVADRNGKYGVNTFRGTINHNGKEVDMSTFSYLPPDRGLAECADPDLAKLNASDGEPPAVYHRPFNFNFGRSYYNPTPRYNLLASGVKGRKATFVIKARGRVKPWSEFSVTTPSGKTVSLGSAAAGDNSYEYVFPEDGVYLFDANFPNDTKDEESNPEGFAIVSATGVDFAFQAGTTRLGKVVNFSTGDDFPKYAGYFEVPGGKECCIKIQGGGIEIRDEDGEIVHRLEKADYQGSKCLLFTPKQDAIWSFRCLEGSMNMKFFDPLPGIWADDPSYLPTYGEDLPFKRIRKEYSSVPEIPVAKLFPLPIKGAVAKAVDEAAAARAEFGKGNAWAKLYGERRYHYDWTEPAAQTQEQLKVAAMELEALEPVRKMRDMERYAGRESEDLRRYVAFVSLYAPVLALDDAAAKKYAASPAVPDDEDYRLKVNAVISPYGAEYLEEGFYYSDYAAVVKLAPFIVDRLEKLEVNK